MIIYEYCCLLWHYVLQFKKLRYDLTNTCRFTYLQLGRDSINLFHLKICHFKTIHRTTFISFWIFDFINEIENFHFIHAMLIASLIMLEIQGDEQEKRFIAIICKE